MVMSFEVARFGAAEHLAVRRLRDAPTSRRLFGDAAGSCCLRKPCLIPIARSLVRPLPFLPRLALPALLTLLLGFDLGLTAAGSEAVPAILPAAIAGHVVIGKVLQRQIVLAGSALFGGLMRGGHDDRPQASWPLPVK